MLNQDKAEEYKAKLISHMHREENVRKESEIDRIKDLKKQGKI